MEVAFVELQARVAVITKNITSFSEVAKFRDPRTEFFYERRDLMQLCKDSLTRLHAVPDEVRNGRQGQEDLKMSISSICRPFARSMSFSARTLKP